MAQRQPPILVHLQQIYMLFCLALLAASYYNASAEMQQHKPLKQQALLVFAVLYPFYDDLQQLLCACLYGDDRAAHYCCPLFGRHPFGHCLFPWLLLEGLC